jgi:tetratricopeptide (TPR) repeat protein
MMRMNTGRTRQFQGVRVGEGEGATRTREIRARDDLAPYARRACPLEDFFQVSIEACVREVCTDVDEFGRQAAMPDCDMLRVAMNGRHDTFKSRGPAAGTCLVLGLLAAAQALHAAAVGGLGGDLQARILYGFQTEDRAQLGELKDSLSAEVAADGGGDALRYQLAHADFRYAALVADENRRDAEAALAECAAETATLLSHDAQSAEALALDSACREELAKFRKLQGVVLRAQAEAHLAQARRLAPANPRILLLLAYKELAAARGGSPHSDAGLEALRRAALRFEATPATDPDVPGWGHAEAYLALGREYFARGDVLAARNWIEKALIAAPDYKAAQRALAALRNSGGHS